MLPPERRLGEVLELIDDNKFFTLHAGRQTGKTTSLQWLDKHLCATGKYRAIWVDIETARENPNVKLAMTSILSSFDRALGFTFPDLTRPDAAEIATSLNSPTTALLSYLNHLASLDPRPWVVLFDEADGLVGEAMVSFLTQLRQGYIERSRSPFPSSVVLVGQRQVRDYVLREEERRAISWLGTTSPFNVTAEAMTLGPFTAPEVEELLVQHTAATGQRFEPAAIAMIYELAQGHPWLTNAMADQIVRKDVKDRSVPITAAHVEAAKETIILERRSHIDSLVARLREDRVRRVIDPMLAGALPAGDMLDDDLGYVVGLGLVRKQGGMMDIANPIYREVIPRALTYAQQVTIGNQPRWYVGKDGSLDTAKLMEDWQYFWREHGHLAAEGFGYRESGPHLMLMAYLQRVINGGGRIEREYGLGRGALDLLITWQNERYVIEVKLRRDTETEQRALQQMARYLDGVGLNEGWLVLFDLRQGPTWEERMYQRDVEFAGKKIRIVGS
jgi:hypothetical protein